MHAVLLTFAVNAALSSTGNHRIGAAARRADGVIVAAFNGSAPHVMPAAHAEARLAGKLTPGSEVCVVRVGGDGKLKLAKPCRRCATRLRHARVAAIWYSDEEGAMVKL